MGFFLCYNGFGGVKVMLTNQQKRFCDLYLSNGLHASKACKDAGYNGKRQYYHNYRAGLLMAKPEIKKYIQERLSKISNNNIIQTEELLEYLSSCVRGNECDTLLVKSNNDYIKEEIPIKQTDRLKATKLMFDYYNLLNGVKNNNDGKPVKIVNDVYKNNFVDVGVLESEEDNEDEQEND